jgi:phage-related protein
VFLDAIAVGMKAVKAKPLKGFGGAGVLEVVVDHDGNTYRAVYTVKFSKIVYVLHAFQKKSKQGTATPRTHLALVKGRLKLAAEQYRQEFKE